MLNKCPATVNRDICHNKSNNNKTLIEEYYSDLKKRYSNLYSQKTYTTSAAKKYILHKNFPEILAKQYKTFLGEKLTSNTPKDVLDLIENRKEALNTFLKNEDTTSKLDSPTIFSLKLNSNLTRASANVRINKSLTKVIISDFEGGHKLLQLDKHSSPSVFDFSSVQDSLYSRNLRSLRVKSDYPSTLLQSPQSNTNLTPNSKDPTPAPASFRFVSATVSSPLPTSLAGFLAPSLTYSAQLTGQLDVCLEPFDTYVDREDVLIQTFRGHRGAVWAVDSNREGTRLLSGGEDWSGRAWSLGKGRQERLLECAGPVEFCRLEGGSLAVLGEACNGLQTKGGPKGRASKVSIWDLREPRAILREDTEGSLLAARLFGSSLLVVSTSGDLQALDLRMTSGRLSRTSYLREALFERGAGLDHSRRRANKYNKFSFVDNSVYGLFNRYRQKYCEKDPSEKREAGKTDEKNIVIGPEESAPNKRKGKKGLGDIQRERKDWVTLSGVSGEYLTWDFSKFARGIDKAVLVDHGDIGENILDCSYGVEGILAFVVK